MNLFTKSLLVSLIPCAAANAQALYSIAPNDDEATQGLPLTFVVGGGIGYDDNPTPLLNNSDNDSFYGNVFGQVNWTSVTPQTTWDVFARLGFRYYFDDLDGQNADQENYSARVGVNFTHRFNERLRFSSRNFLAYEIEPDYDYEIANDRRSGQYFRYSSNNSVGYRWSERLGTQTGVTFSGILYDDLEDSDFNSVTFRHDFRYRVSPATVVTAGYQYREIDNDVGGDVSQHFITGGVEHRISPVSAIVLRAGVQISDPDIGSDRSRPFVEAALRSQLTEQFSTNTFVRYSNEGWNRRLITGDGQSIGFENNQTLRVGSRGTYALNPQVSLFGGVSVIYTEYDDPIDDGNPLTNERDGSETLLHLNVGASYQVSEGLFLTGSYNYTHSYSDFDREYDRNRFQLGVQTTF